MTGSPIHVAASGGWSWTTPLVALLNAVVIGAIGVWLKTRPRMRELDKSAEEKLRDDLITRVEKLEQRSEQERADHDAMMAVMRHRLNNVTQCLDALLMLIEQDPTRAQEAAARVREMRSKQEQAEAQEKGAIHAAKITAAGPGTPSA